MEQLFISNDGSYYFVADLNKPGSYNAETDQLTGFVYEKEKYQGCYKVAYRDLRPVHNPPSWYLIRKNTIKHTITSLAGDRRIDIYFDDRITVVDIEQNERHYTHITAEEIAEVIEAINRDKIVVNVTTYDLKK